MQDEWTHFSNVSEITSKKRIYFWKLSENFFKWANHFKKTSTSKDSNSDCVLFVPLEKNFPFFFFFFYH